MADFVFIVAGENRKPARDVLATRVADGVWPLNRRTPHQAALSRGDRIVFYAAKAGGGDIMSFIARGIVGGSRVPSTRHDPDRPTWLGIQPNQLYDVPVVDVEWFPSPSPARGLIERLGFVKNPDAWGSYFQGGIRRLSEGDYETIVEAAFASA